MKNYKAIGVIGEGTFSEVMKMQSLRDGNYYACKQMKLSFDSLQPLFPGENELDQISKIHDVIGTPAQKTLIKFKQKENGHQGLLPLPTPDTCATLYIWL